MNSVSFGSTFKIRDNKHDYVNNYKIMDFCEKNDLEYGSKTEIIKPAKNYHDVPMYTVNTTIIAPDHKDAFVESYLANKGVSFKKLSTTDLLDKTKIEERIQDAPKNMQLVNLDVEKLEQILQNQSNNIEYCEDNYNNYYKDRVNSLIKSGDKIPATTLYINPAGDSVEGSIDYINNFGTDRLNDNQFVLMFNQSTDEPDHCMFFGMKDLGMDKVPVYVNKDTYQLGHALGLFK